MDDPSVSGAGRMSTASAGDPDAISAELLRYWEGVLDQLSSGGPAGTQGAAAGLLTGQGQERLRELLASAVRLRAGQSQGMLPEQLVAALMRFYDEALQPADKPHFFRLLTRDFGVNGEWGHGATGALCGKELSSDLTALYICIASQPPAQCHTMEVLTSDISCLQRTKLMPR